MPSGSRPLAGSSRIEHLGSPSSAARGRGVGASRGRTLRPAGRRRRSSPTCSRTSRPGRRAGRRPRRARAGDLGPGARGGSWSPRGRRRRGGPARAAPRTARRRWWPSRGRRDQTQQHPQRRGLAGAVGAEEAGDRALLTPKLRSSTATTSPKRLVSPSDLEKSCLRLCAPGWGRGVIAGEDSFPLRWAADLGCFDLRLLGEESPTCSVTVESMRGREP